MAIIQDTRLKSTMKSAILSVMYGPYETRLHEKLKGLVLRNCILQHTSLELFSFRGHSYGLPMPGHFIKPKLHPDLHKEMQEWLDEQIDVWNHERPFVDNYITLVLNSSASAMDWIRLLPESFHRPINEILTMNSTWPEMLSDCEVVMIKEANQKAIRLMKERMTVNLLQT